MITNGNAENLKCTKVYEEAYKREPDAVHPFYFYKEKDLKTNPILPYSKSMVIWDLLF